MPLEQYDGTNLQKISETEKGEGREKRDWAAERLEERREEVVPRQGIGSRKRIREKLPWIR